MTIESINGETQSLGKDEDLCNNEASITWNGRAVTADYNPSRPFPIIHHSASPEEPRIVLCGDTVDGSVSVRGSADTDGNKSVEAELKVSDKEEKVSGSVSAEVKQDSSGSTSGKVEVEATVRF